MDRSRAHQELIREILLKIGNYPDVVLWTNQVGRAKQGRFTVSYGLCRGSADLIGIGPGGKFISAEIKTGEGVLSAVQRAWLQLVRKYGGSGFVWRSLEEAERDVEEMRRATT